MLATSLWSNDDGGADPTASTGASSTRTLSPTPGSQAPPAMSSPPDSAGLPTTTEQTRLRNLAADLCLDIRGGKAKAGASTKLAVCSSAWTQQWSYEEDGLLRSIANPELCLDSHADNGVVFLDLCAAKSAAGGEDERYDLTVRGELLPRWNDGLAVAPASTDPDADIVVKVRDGSDVQRWRTDASSAGPESLSIAGTTSPSTRPTSAPPSAGGTPEVPSEPPNEQSTGVPVEPEATPTETYQEPRAVAVSDGDDNGSASARPALPLPLQLPDVITGVGL